MDYRIVLASIALLSALISIVCNLVLGKKINLKDLTTIKSYICQILPNILNATEKLEGADVKKETAIATAVSFVNDKFGTLKEKDLKTIVAFTGSQIESILSTPQKKKKED